MGAWGLVNGAWCMVNWEWGMLDCSMRDRAIAVQSGCGA